MYGAKINKDTEKKIGYIEKKLIKMGLSEEHVKILSSEATPFIALKAATDSFLSYIINMILKEKLSAEELALITYLGFDENLSKSYIPVLKQHKITPAKVESIQKLHLNKCIKNTDDLDAVLKATSEKSWETIAKVLSSSAVAKAISCGKCDIKAVLDVISNNAFSEAQIKILDYNLNMYDIKTVLEVIPKYELTADQLELFNCKYIKTLMYVNKSASFEQLLEVVSKHHLTKAQIDTLHLDSYNFDPECRYQLDKLDNAMYNLEKYNSIDQPLFALIWEMMGFYSEAPLVAAQTDDNY